MRCALLAAVLLAGVISCRDGVPVFAPHPRPPADGAVRQLTFGAGQDRDPRWTPAGDSLLYHTDVFSATPASPGTLLRIGATGGTAAPAFPDLASVRFRLLATPAHSPTGDRIAYMDVSDRDLAIPCFRDGTRPPNDQPCRSTQPLLVRGTLRVRRVGETQPYDRDAGIAITFAGADPRLRAGEEGPYLQRVFPFQAQYSAERAMLFRPSWHPDGQRIAFSDGLQLFVWRVGDAAAAPVPGTADGVSAAWSPDGAWLAFTVLARTDSAIIDCTCGVTGLSPIELHRRVVYTVTAPRLVVLRADGAERTELGAGEDAAWSPDGQFIYARRGSEIVRITRQNGAAIAVPHTSQGRAPAVSPDGRLLAFARRKDLPLRDFIEQIDYDIWIVSLVP